MKTRSLQARVVPIDELAAVYPGYSPRPEEREQSGKYLLVGGRNIRDGRLVKTTQDAYIADIPKDSFRRAIAQEGDIIVSTLFDRRKLHIYRHIDPRAVVNNSCAIIRALDKNDYIVSYLRTIKGKEQFLHDASEATSGSFIPRLSISDLRGIQIPLLPLEELQRLGDDHIESSSTNDLIALRSELRSKDAQISELQQQLTQVRDYYENRLNKIQTQISTNELRSKIARGESSTLEFKSSLRWSMSENRIDANLELAVLKTIAAFCNRAGGELLIGVADDHTILGIEHDRFPNDDKFLLHLTDCIINKLIPKVVGYVDVKIVTLDGKKICHVECKRSAKAVWVKSDKNTLEQFYVRTGPSSRVLPPREAAEYILENFPK